MKQNHTGRKALALLLALCMAVMLLPVSASADNSSYYFWHGNQGYRLAIYEPAGLTEWRENDQGITPMEVTEVEFYADWIPIKDIPAGSFQDIFATSLELPDSVQTIGADAFAYSQIESLSVPANIKLEENALRGLRTLSSLTVRMQTGSYNLVTISRYEKGNYKGVVDFENYGQKISNLVLSGEARASVSEYFKGDKLPKITVKTGAILTLEKAGLDLSGISVEEGGNVVNSTGEPITIQGITMSPGVEYKSCVPIATQPKSMTAVEGRDRATFSVKMVNSNLDLHYQWQRKVSGSSEWKDIPGEENATAVTSDFSADTVMQEKNGSQYRCVITQKWAGEKTATQTSGSATLTVISFTVGTGLTATFDKEKIYAGADVRLTGDVTPEEASNKQYRWEVASAGETGATIDEKNVLHTTGPGSLTVQPVLIDAKQTIDQKTGKVTFQDVLLDEVALEVKPAYVAVTSVEAPPQIVSTESILHNGYLELPTKTVPENATHSTVTWEITGVNLRDDYGDSGSAKLRDGNKLEISYGYEMTGQVYLRATVKDGGGSASSPRDYTKSFIIIVGDYPELAQTSHEVTATVGQLPPTLSSSCSTRSWKDYDKTFELTYEWQAYNPETNRWEAAAGENSGREYKIPAGSCGADKNGRVTSAMDGCRLRCIASYQRKQLQAETFTYKTKFVNVEKIEGAATKICIKTPIELGGSILPENASGTQISYTVTDAGTTGAEIQDGKLICTGAGTAIIRMTVKNGKLDGEGKLSDYTQDLEVKAFDAPPVIGDQPPKDVYYVWYNGPSFSISLDPAVTDPSLAFQWYVSKDNGKNWEILTDSSGYYATNRAELRLPPGSFQEGWEYREGWQYKCEVKNGKGTTTSEICTIHPRKAFEKAEVSGLPSVLKEDVMYEVTVEITPENCLLSSSGKLIDELPPCQLKWNYSKENFTVTDAGANAWNITPQKQSTLPLQLELTQAGITRTIDYQVNVTLEAPKNATVIAESLEPSQSELTVNQYEPARLSVTCEGEQLHYQWQSSKNEDGADWIDIGNANAISYTVPTQAADSKGTQYRCVVSNDAGSVESNAITVKVKAVEQIPPVVITEQPENMPVSEGTGVVFGVTATGKDLTYQWQQSADAGVNWAEIEGETSGLLVLSTTAADMDGYQYRCAVTGEEGTAEESKEVTVYSQAATLTVESYATVEAVVPDFTEFYLHVKNPVSGTAKWSGKSESTEEILWFLVDDGGTGAVLTQENQLTAQNEGTVTLVAMVNNGSDPYNPYRQEFTVPVVTDPERTPPTVYSVEDSELTLVQGQQTYLLAAAEPAAGEELTYQWQFSTDQINWANLEGEVSSDYQTPPAEAGKTVSYRCKVSNEYGFAFTGIYTVEGAAAKPVTGITLSLNELRAGGEPVYLSSYAAVAPGDASYQNIQWTISHAGETGARFDEYGCLAAEKAGTVTLTATIVNGRLGSSPDVLNGDSNYDYTKEFTLTALEPAAKPPEILAQPKDLTVPEGSRAVFMVWTSGADVGYQWQRRGSATEEWQDLKDGVATAVYEIPQVSRSDSGSQFRCVLSNASPERVTTDTATLTVTPNGSSGGGGSAEPGLDDEPKDLPFTDVSKTDWFYDSVNYVYEKGLFHGTSETAFSPDGKMTRGMAVTVLYRVAGSPAPEGGLDSPFADVDPNAYYAAAVYWARSSGIMMGIGDDSFAPNSSLTREQLAATLYRFAGSPEVTGTLGSFTDGASASKYAEQALCWAVEQGILTGKGGGVLDPKGTAKRCEIAAMVMRYCLLEL